MSPRRLVKLPKRSDRYKGSRCAARVGRGRCKASVTHIARYPSGHGDTADRLYCTAHAERFAERWGLRKRARKLGP